MKNNSESPEISHKQERDAFCLIRKAGTKTSIKEIPGYWLT
jgi:hypothetical protein